MHDDLAQFRDYYADRFAAGMAKFVSLYGQGFLGLLKDSLKRDRSVVYIFGNGGSHAIGQCLSYALKSYASEREWPVRVQTGVDVHQLTSTSSTQEPGISFTQILRDEGADARDIVILISGSGDSDNLCSAARYTFQSGIPTFALVGSSCGKLRELVPAQRYFLSPVEDQQISEDIIQSFAYFFDQVDQAGRPTEWAGIVSQRAEQLRQTIRNIPASILDDVSDLIVNAFDRRKTIWVLGLEHPALSACAEHTAHNLYWDGVYQVANPPRRTITSSPTACNLSGISNDRRRGVFRNLTGIRDAQDDGLALLFAARSDSPFCTDLLDELQRTAIPTCLFFGDGSYSNPVENISVHGSKIPDPQMHAAVSQIFGHMLGRIVRFKLLRRQGLPTTQPVGDPVKFLKDHDLAQRRLIDD